MTIQIQQQLRARQINESDLSLVVDLLARKFPSCSREYFDRGLDRLARRPAPTGYPRFGYMLESQGAPVGVVLTIFSTRSSNGKTSVRCNLSSWCIDEAFSGCGPFLSAIAVRHKDVTYISESAAPHTWRLMEAQGFVRFCEGRMLTFPALTCRQRIGKARARRFDEREDYGPDLSREERDILIAHSNYGCLAYVVEEERGAHPFVFLRRRIPRRLLSTLELIYCRSVEDYRHYAGPLGRALMARGAFSVVLDANHPIPDLVGEYSPVVMGKYIKGPALPRFGDLAFSEAALFGRP
ncbi:hypothetical protein [Methylocystis bryophila]|uniref:Acyl-CoA acyltransferase n=1 Tax=Methylocystis bryophila TaxID=655015 RepID=A0A1W6MV43_9HYPH|nr:hypothetical protein [Methylocystis bryophila]ARN81483.1 hypothetical protein B1812_10830 [Methylocystis bryophila]BDV37499.1 hypothetical protein DSM21852_07520 [Methylocystis bryophila]